VAELMTRKEVMAVIGIGRDKLRTLGECGLLTPVHLVIDEHGRPLDRAMFKRMDVERIIGRPMEGTR